MGKFFGLFYSLSEKQVEIAAALRENSLESRTVIGRGSIFVDAKDIKQTQKFKDLLLKAEEVEIHN
jgi:hypothetical protein